MKSRVEKIKSLISLEELLAEEGITLKGGRCRCPLHQGDNPTSFCVKDGYFHCFSCGSSGDLFTYVQLRHNLDFQGAMSYLKAEVGIAKDQEIKEPKPRHITRETDYDKHLRKTIDDTILFLQEMMTAFLKNLEKDLREGKISLPEYYQKQQILEYRLNCLDEHSIYLNYEKHKHMRGKLDEQRSIG